MGTVLAWAPAAAAEGVVRLAGAPDAVPDRYIVVLKDQYGASAVDRAAAGLAERVGAQVRGTYGAALRGFSVAASLAQARRIAADPAVSFVEQDQYNHPDGIQECPVNFGLDRIDQRGNANNDHLYHYDTRGDGVSLYVIDTGVNTSHTDFGGRAHAAWDATTKTQAHGDCGGHGTHVAGIAGGTRAGVAKGVEVHSVRIYECRHGRPGA